MTTRFAVLDTTTNCFVRENEWGSHLFEKQERAEREREKSPETREVVTVER